MPQVPKGPNKPLSKRQGLLWIFTPIVAAALMWGVATFAVPHVLPASDQNGACPTALSIDPGGFACGISVEGVPLTGLTIVAIVASILLIVFIIFIPVGLTVGTLKLRGSRKKWPIWLASAIPIGVIVGALVIWYLLFIQ